MNAVNAFLEDYIVGDRMGTLEEALAQNSKVDCGEKKFSAAGPVLWSDGRQMVMDTSDAHTLIISSTGGGKTVSQVMPMLRAVIKAGESLFVTDVKSGELYEQSWSYLKQQGYRVCVINMRQPLQGGQYNPLYLPLKLLQSENIQIEAMGHQMLAQAADALLMCEEVGNDPFWTQAARDTFLGLVYLLSCMELEETWWNMRTVFDLFEYLQIRGIDRAKKEMELLQKTECLNTAKRLLRTYLYSADSPRTRASIDATMAGKLNQFLGTALQMDLLCGNDVHFEMLDQERTAIFLLLPDETDIWNTHASLLVTQVYQYLCILASGYPGGRLPNRFHFILEEFGNLNLGDSAAAMFSAGRSRNIRVTAVLQNLAQLDQCYGAEVGNAIRFNCGNWIYLYSRDLDTLRQLSELCGTRTYLDKGITRPVASVADLQRIPQGQALIFQPRKRPYMTQLAPIWDYPMTAEEKTEDELYPKRSFGTQKTYVPDFEKWSFIT